MSTYSSSMNTARYFVGVLLVTFMPPALIWWFVVHPFVGFWRHLGPKVTLTVMGVLGIAGAMALMSVRDRLLGRDLGTHPPLVVIALLLLAVTAWIAVHRRRQLTPRILAGVPELSRDDDDQVLLTEGVYGRIRHPRYVEVLAGTWAYAVFANHVGAYVVASLTVPALHLIVLLEERELHRRFGERYEAYRARVPRYVPRLH